MTLKELGGGFNMDTSTILEILALPYEIPDSTRIFDLEDIDDALTMKTVKSILVEYPSIP